MAKKRFGEILVARGVISPAQLNEALKLQRRKRMRLGAALVELGFLNEDQLVTALGAALAIAVVDLRTAPISEEAVKKLDPSIAAQHEVFPFQRRGNSLLLAMADPLNVAVIDEVGFRTGSKIQPVLARASDIHAAIRKHYGTHGAWQVNRGGKPISILEDDAPMTIVRGGQEEEIVDTGFRPSQSPPPPPARPSQAPPPAVPLRPSQPVAYAATAPATFVGRPSQPPPLAGFTDDMLSERTSPAVSEALGALIDSRGGIVDAESFARLERRFWAVLRLLAKKGLIHRDEFLAELGDE
ncbi:MAG: hypothetical protein HYV07_33345 [Deltaproteobacteria bacterium]|nr:hypothetical protein [Deltaproteobacteria bacterium]